MKAHRTQVLLCLLCAHCGVACALCIVHCARSLQAVAVIRWCLFWIACGSIAMLILTGSPKIDILGLGDFTDGGDAKPLPLLLLLLLAAAAAAAAASGADARRCGATAAAAAALNDSRRGGS